MIGSIVFLKRRMPAAFVKRYDTSWYVIEYRGLYDPFACFDNPAHFGVTVAMTENRCDARLVARRRRESLK